MAQRRALLAQEEAAAISAKNTEIAALAKVAESPGASNKEIEAYLTACNQKLDLERQFKAKKAELDRKDAAQQRQQFEQVYEAMTSGANASVAGLIKGTMSWGEAMRSAASSALDSMINMYVQMGLKKGETTLEGMIYDKEAQASQITGAMAANVAQATGAAAVYSVNAMASVAAIPVTGWAMAPGVGAEAYSAGLSMASMASAAGGWERVTADQVAMIHKDETILPAPYAQGLRQIIAKGQTGGGDTHVHAHFHGVTNADWWDANQGNILKQLSKAVSNRRKS